jgi:hypothetical protein
MSNSLKGEVGIGIRSDGECSVRIQMNTFESLRSLLD